MTSAVTLERENQMMYWIQSNKPKIKHDLEATETVALSAA